MRIQATRRRATAQICLIVWVSVGILAGCPKEAEIGPHSPSLLYRMALLNLQKGNLDAAQRQLQEAESKDASNPDILNAMGLVDLKREDYGSAERFFGRAIELNPGSGMYHVNRAFARLKLRRHDEALADLDMALSPDSGFTAPQLALFYKGETYFDLQLLDQAAESYRAGLSYAPQNPEMRSRLGQVLYAMGEADQAITEFQECAKQNPGFSEVQFQMGRVYLDRSRNEEACAAFARYLELAPEGENAEPARRYMEVLKKENSCPPGPGPQASATGF